MTSIQTLVFPPREFYDPGSYIVKQTDTIKSGAVDGAIWSNDTGDLSFVLQPGILYRVVASTIFQMVSASGGPGVAVRWLDDANLTFMQLLNKGTTFNTSAVGQFNSFTSGKPYHKDQMTLGYYNSSSTVTVGQHYNDVWDGFVACENSPTVLTPEWKHNSAAAGRVDFKATVSWMWVRAEGVL